MLELVVEAVVGVLREERHLSVVGHGYSFVEALTAMRFRAVGGGYVERPGIEPGRFLTYESTGPSKR
ncbi:hypothetical protein CHE218_00200 [Microbacterium sp. che218]